MSFDKFRVLTWKNWTLQKRRPIAGAIQILFPIIVIVLFTWARNVFGNEFDALLRTDAESFTLGNFTACASDEFTPLAKIHFAPNNAAYQELFQEAFGSRFPIEGHEESDLWRMMINNTEQSVGVRLFSESPVTSVLPSIVDFEFEYRYYVYPIESCQVMIQNELEKAFIKMKTQVAVEDAFMQEFPYEDIFNQIFTELMIYLMPFFLVLSTFATVSGVIKSISSEQKSRVKELMKIMGLSRTINWLSWYSKWIVMSLISYTFVTLFLCVPIIGDQAIFSFSNFFLIWIFFFFYCSSVITFCFLVSVLFQKAQSVDGVGVTLFFVTYVPYFIYVTKFDSLAYIVRWLICLPVNTSMGVAISIVLNMEANRQGINFSNLFTHVEGFGFSFGETLFCLLLSTVIHVLITVYIEMVFPGEVGIPKPWYFPFQSCMRLIRKDKSNFDAHYSRGSFDARTGISSENFEEDPKHLSPSVKIENLTKYFGPNVAVDNLSMNMYQDQIFVLCGHNGAGKTTTMSMLIGMLPPSSGTAYINGFDITTELNEARKSIGICPQNNILFNDLTVREHIIFFCKLKGMKDGKKISKEVKKYVEMLGLKEKINSRSKTLSGGQKRRLSIANALCGQSTFVILDEPTSGLDVKARRNLWDLLIQEKKGRTILLSTHYMEEAEVLSDRVAIMNEGKLKAIGTSYFLKKRFGSGYRLIVVKKENCDSKNVLHVLQKYAPDASIESEEQAEVTFIISDEYLEKFDKIFKRLEDEAEELKISSFGCSISTLEEVFLKVGVDKFQSNQSDTILSVTNPFTEFGKVSTVKLFFNQIYAMILKKFHYTRRNVSPYIYLAFITIGLSFVFLYAPLNLEVNFDLELTSLIHTENPNNATVQTYKSFFYDHQVDVTNLEPKDYISQSFLRRNLKYEMGVSFDIKPVSVLWNRYSLTDAMPFALNYYHRAVLQSQSNCVDCDIRYVNDPYEYFRNRETTTTPPNTESDFQQFQEILIYILFFFVMVYWSSMHIVMRIKEQTTKAKLLQFISGANRFTYTMTNFLIDFGIFYIVVCIVLGMVAATGRSGFTSGDDIILYLSIFACYGFNTIAWIYLITPWFKNPLAGESAASNISFGIKQTDVVIFIYKFIYHIGIFFAPFALNNCYQKIQISKFEGTEIWSWGLNGIISSLVFMIMGGVIFMTIVFMRDFLVFKWIRYKLMPSWKKMPQPNPTGDDDVQREMERVKSKNKSEVDKSHLVLDGLSKFYGNNLAVNQLHVSVETAECFGILGVNGAGKTTTFQMMTGDETISSGNGFVHGFNLKSQIPKVYQNIGYCPQFDALLPDLSGRETLKIFCLLRGIPNNEIEGVISTFSNELGFEKHLDKKVENFSGGNKRKLSTALALIGNLSLIFLDECSSGMDPKAKRQLWSIITKTRNSGKAVILTSHSMQECEALCTKLAIMVDGSFSCLGSIQHLKNKFSKGFVLTIKMAKQDDQSHFDSILKRVTEAFPTAELKEIFMELLTFHINTTELKWSKVFEELAQMKREIGISDYTMTQSSLESVFLFFSKQGKRVVE